MRELAMHGPSYNVQRVEGLDHIRGFAALIVVVHHAYWAALGQVRPPMITWERWPSVSPWLAPLVESHFAVALFFCASGFIFTLVGFQQRIRYAGFLRNRCLRVLPLYYTVLFAGISLYPERFSLLGFVSSATIFADISVAALNLHPVSTAFWTVAVEMQFYLIFPLIIAAINRDGFRLAWRIIGLMLVFRVLGAALGISIRDTYYWHLIPGRLGQFMFGMLAAVIWMRLRGDPRASSLPKANAFTASLQRALQSRPGTMVLLTAGALWAWTAVLNRWGGYPNNSWWRVTTPDLEGALCALFLLAWLSYVHRLPTWLNRALDRLGDLSFGCYLIHFAVVGALIGDPYRPLLLPGHLDRMPLPTTWPAELKAALYTALAVIIAWGIAWMLHTTVERPFMGLRTRYVGDPAQDSSPALAAGSEAAPASADPVPPPTTTSPASDAGGNGDGSA